MAANVERLLTIADLDAFPDDDGNRYELIEGVLYVSTAPGLPHQLVLNNLQVELTLYLRAHPIGVIAPGPGTIFSNYDAVIPDIVIIRHERWESVRPAQKITDAIFRSSGSSTRNTALRSIGSLIMMIGLSRSIACRIKFWKR